MWKAYGIHEPVEELRFAPPRRWRFDYAWPKHMIALEVEGGLWTYGRHNRAASMIKDIEKYSIAAILGWCVIRVTPQEVYKCGVEMVRLALMLREKLVPVAGVKETQKIVDAWRAWQNIKKNGMKSNY